MSVEVRILKDYSISPDKIIKSGEIINTSKKSAEHLISIGFAEYIIKDNIKNKKKVEEIVEINSESNILLYNIVDNYEFLKSFINKIVVLRLTPTDKPLWKQNREKYLFNGIITNQNLREVLPNEIIIEFDHLTNDYEKNRKDSLESIEKVKQVLIERKIFFRITDHKGKSPHIRFVIDGLENEEHHLRVLYKQMIVKELTKNIQLTNTTLDNSLITSVSKLISLELQPHWKPEWNNEIEQVIFENKEGKIPKLNVETVLSLKKDAERNVKQDELLININVKESDINYESLLKFFKDYFVKGKMNAILMAYGGLCNRFGLSENDCINIISKIINTIDIDNRNPDVFIKEIKSKIKYCFKLDSKEVAVKHFITQVYDDKVYYEFLECFNIKDLMIKMIEIDINLLDKNSSVLEIENIIKRLFVNVKDKNSCLLLLETISKKTDKSKKSIVSTFESLIQKSPDTPTNYQIKNSKHGIYFGKTTFNVETGEEVFLQISNFRKLEKQSVTDYDLYKCQFTKHKQIYTEPSLKKEHEPLVIRNEFDYPAAIESSKSKSGYQVLIEDIDAFISLVNNFESKDVNAVNVYGYCEKQYYEPKDYSCFKIINKRIGDARVDERESGYIDQNFINFVEMNFDQNKVDECIKILKELPRDKREAEIWKIVLSWSVAAKLKMELHRLKCTIYPMLILIGDHDTGKTKINEVAVLNLWNSKSRPTSDFGGVAGARIRDLPCDTRPICYQELDEFHKNWIPMLKEGMTAGKFTISRGSKHDRIEEHFYQNIAIDTNDLTLNNVALENRAIIIKKDSPKNKVNNEANLNYLVENITHVGKFLYDNFKNIEIENLWIESKKYISENVISELNKKESIKEGRRMTEKLATIRFGELILEKYGILVGEEIDYFRLYKDDEIELINRKAELSDLIMRIISSVNVKHNGYNYTISQLIENDFAMVSDIFYQLKDNYGIGISKGGEIILLSNFISLLNNLMEKNGQRKIMNLTSLSKDLGIVYDSSKKPNFWINKVEKMATTMHGINISNLHKNMFSELDEESKKLLKIKKDKTTDI